MSKETVYTEAVVESMTRAYTAAETDEQRAGAVQEIAQEVGASVASVRAKLVSLGIYKAKIRTTKDGAKIESKADIVGQIAVSLGVQEEDVDSLEKATKPVLKLLREALQADEDPTDV